MHGLDALLFQTGFQAEVEVGRVNTDETVGSVGQQAVPQGAAGGPDFVD